MFLKKVSVARADEMTAISNWWIKNNKRMAHKKYYGYKPKFEYYQVVLYEKEGKVGEKILENFLQLTTDNR